MIRRLIPSFLALVAFVFVTETATAADNGSDTAGTEAAVEEDVDQGDASRAATEAEESVALPRRLAEFTQSAAENSMEQVQQAVSVFTALGYSDLEVDWASFGAGMADLAAVVLATIVVFIALRWLGRGVFAIANRLALRGNTSVSAIYRVIAVAIAFVADAFVVGMAWVSGYAVALFGVGEAGFMTTQQSLFLNAFLSIEIAKSVIRVVFAPKDEGLRLVPIAAGDASYWNARLAVLIGCLGYGLMLVVPVVAGGISPVVAGVLSPIIKVAAFAFAVGTVLRNRHRVRSQLLAWDARLQGIAAFMVELLAYVWHALALVYLTGLLIASLLADETAMPFMVAATVQTVLAIAAGVFVSVLLGQLLKRRLRVPERIRERIPLLEQRLNDFVPRALQVVRLFIGVVVTAMVIDAWRIFFDLSEWVTSDAGLAVIGALISVTLIVILATGIWIGFASWIEHGLSDSAGKGEPGGRASTLLSLLRTAGGVVLVTITVMIVLSELGLNIGPMLAGAGVLGLAIGFGAQKLVQDVITGVFIQLENSVNQGDYITVSGTSGTVERVSLRSVALRDLSGTVHVIPFSSVDMVSNFTREFAYHLGIYRISHHESVDEAVAQLRVAFDELAQDPDMAPKLLGGLEVDGVSEIADSSIDIQVRVMTTPGDQWSVGRAYNKLVKGYFDAAGIDIPFPHRTLYYGDRGDLSQYEGAESGTSDSADRSSEGEGAAEG